MDFEDIPDKPGEVSQVFKDVNCDEGEEEECYINTEEEDDDDYNTRDDNDLHVQVKKGDIKAGHFLQVDIIEESTKRSEAHVVEEMMEVSSCDNSVSEIESDKCEDVQLQSTNSVHNKAKPIEISVETADSENEGNVADKVSEEQMDSLPKVNSVIGGYAVHHVVAALHDYYAQIKNYTVKDKLPVNPAVLNSQRSKLCSTSRNRNIRTRDETTSKNRHMELKKKILNEKKKKLNEKLKNLRRIEHEIFLTEYKKRIQVNHEHELRILERKCELERRKERLKQDKCKFEEEMKKRKLEFETELVEKHKAAIAEIETQENILRGGNPHNKLIELLSQYLHNGEKG